MNANDFTDLSGIAYHRRHRLLRRIDVETDKPIIDPEITADTSDEENIGETVNYSPEIGSPEIIKPKSKDVTDPESLTPVYDVSVDDEFDVIEPNDYTPKPVIDYFHEAALTAKDKKALDDSDYGLPHLKKYPMPDEAHVRQAIRMFHHCKKDSDKKILAKNIQKKIREFKMDVDIGEKNPLYKYINEAADVNPRIQVYGAEIPNSSRTKEQVVKEHLKVNNMFYHHLFYSNDFAKSVMALNEFEFLSYFYPDFKSFNFYTRMRSSLGGLVSKDTYQAIGIRYPLETDFTRKLGVLKPSVMEDEMSISLNITSAYNPESNWYKENCDDLDHLMYCLQLYSIVGEIMLDPQFTVEKLEIEHMNILHDWSLRVHEHYDNLKDYPMDTPGYIKEAQYLHDLLWSHIDNPDNETDITANILAMIEAMPSVNELMISVNESTEMISKQDCAGYITKELGMEDDMFLLPDQLEYPIINKNSVRIAMDIIGRIPEDQQRIYVKNLNRKYRELGCTFSITPDHPYAPYADKNIVSHMSQLLSEEGSGVDDHGTSTTIPEFDGWVTRHDLHQDDQILRNDEMGPNTKRALPDWSEKEESIL